AGRRPAPAPGSSRSGPGSAKWERSTSSVLRVRRPGGWLEPMQVSVDARREGGVDALHPRDLLLAGGLQAGQAAEMAQQRGAAARADARDVLQSAAGARLLPLGAVAGDGETVRLVAHLLDEL